MTGMLDPLRDLVGRGRWWARGVHERYLLDYVFIHINKTAGSSIARALGLTGEHKTALQKKRELGERAWTERFSFTVVRNPWDKVVSHYSYRVRTNQTGLGVEPLPFEEWVRLAYRDRDPRYCDDPRMFMPQWEWIADESGQMMVDFVGRFENLQEDFARISERIGKHASLPHVKKSDRGGYRDYYDAGTRSIVADVFREDVERFGYAF